MKPNVTIREIGGLPRFLVSFLFLHARKYGFFCFTMSDFRNFYARNDKFLLFFYSPKFWCKKTRQLKLPETASSQPVMNRL